ncbi:MAG TPA: OmpA family protein [Candidatus Angelobacter sp.]|nr:OmpA family protein [Candidatus Angelobacter sp.]
MKKTGLFLVLALSAASWGQAAAPTPAQKGQRTNLNIGNSPTPADMYCSGYITADNVPTDHFVAAGWNSFDQTRYAALADVVYLHGPNMKEGDRFAIVRHVRDANHYESYRGQRSAVREAGKPYFEMGIVRVIDVQKNIAVAVPELACGEFVLGDVAVPFVERQAPLFRSVTLDRYAPPSGKTQGRIIMAKEFDTLAGSKYAVYTNLGSDKGIKVGDYLKATRTYTATYHDPEAGMTRKASANEDQQASPQKFGDVSSLPRRTLGDMIVLNVNRKSSTAMVLNAFEDIHVGDGVELMDVSAAPELQPVRPVSVVQPTAPADTSASPPNITCSAAPPSVRMGESSTITCDATSPDNRPLSITFVANGGKLSSSRNQAHLDTTDAGAGPIAVRATAFDDRQLSATAVTTVNVEAPVSAKPVAQSMTSLEFKPMSAYVDNRSKAILDDVALKLQQDPNSTALLSGSAEEKEPSRLATQRAENTKTYLTKSKGIDPARIQTKTGATPGRKVEIWTVPPGAAPPQ